MKRQARTALLLLTSLFGSGCAGMAKYDSGVIHPFKACTTDVACVGLSVYYVFAGIPDDVARDPFGFIARPAFIPFIMLDLPPSFISDLITFPYDLCHVGEEIPKRRGEEEEPKPDGSKDGPEDPDGHAPKESDAPH